MLRHSHRTRPECVSSLTLSLGMTQPRTVPHGARTRHTGATVDASVSERLDSHESSTQSVTDTHIDAQMSLLSRCYMDTSRPPVPHATRGIVIRRAAVRRPRSPRQRAHITTSEATHGSRRTSVVTPHPSGTRTPARHVASATVRYTLTTLHRPRTTPPNKVKVQGRSYGRRVLHRTIPLFQLLR